MSRKTEIKVEWDDLAYFVQAERGRGGKAAEDQFRAAKEIPEGELDNWLENQAANLIDEYAALSRVPFGEAKKILSARKVRDRDRDVDQLTEGFRKADDIDDGYYLVESGFAAAFVKLVQMRARPMVYLEELQALQRGGGRRAMEIIVQRADELDVTLMLVPDPLLPMAPRVTRRRTEEELVAYYAGFGFVLQDDGEMIRTPKG